MRIVPASLLLQRITDSIEKDVTQSLPTPFLRSQSIAIVSLLSNLAERMDERADILAPQNGEMRRILEEAREILSAVDGARTTIKSIKEMTDDSYAVLMEENMNLRRVLYLVIEALYEWEGELDGERLAAIRVRIRTYLRRQLDQDMAIYHPVRAGKMFRGA